MRIEEHLLGQLDQITKSMQLDDMGDLQWEDAQLIRASHLRCRRGDLSGWSEFISHLAKYPTVAGAIGEILQQQQWAHHDDDSLETVLDFPAEFPSLSAQVESDLLRVLNPSDLVPDSVPANNRAAGELMYIEEKPDLCGPGRIGRVTFSGSRKTLYYRDLKLQSLKGYGHKANYFDVHTDVWYWVSRCKRDGCDTLYPAAVAIDEDAREQYWTEIRKLPEHVNKSSVKSPGKYSKRRPK